MILYGNVVAEGIYEDIKKQLVNYSLRPKLGVVLVGDNAVSKKYIAQKEKAAYKLGFDFELYNFDETISQKDLQEEIQKLNNDTSVHGYIVQLPLPKHIDVDSVISCINPIKDVDGFHPENIGKVLIGESTGIVSCTPAGVMKLLSYYTIDISGKNIVIIGRSNIVGKPLAALTINAGATVTVCNSRTKDIASFTKKADIVVVATGQAQLLKKDMIGKHSVVIDVGFSMNDGVIYGDTDYENIIAEGNPITPVPGGVGPMTVAMLMSNTFEAFKKSYE